MESDCVIRVAVPVPLPRLFDYRLADGMAASDVEPGARVLVEFGRRRLVGVVAEVLAGETASLKPLLVALDTAATGGVLFDPALWSVIQRAARYYHAPLGEMLATALPVGLRRAHSVACRTEHLYVLNPSATALPRGKAQRRLWESLRDGARTAAELSALHDRWRPLLNAWIAQGLVDAIEVSPFRPPPILAAGPELAPEQAQVLEPLLASLGQFRVHLLDGVTGSGKTEVYLRVLAETIARGGQGLLLVPEIGLTPQLIARVRERLPARVAAVHSELSEGERMQVHLAAARGEVDVIIGTRSAVWTPLQRLAVILVDEEHDSSFKQQDGVRYHARDVALLRAQAVAAPVILGSATPSLESLQNVRLGRFEHQHMRHRIGGAVEPRWRVVDLRRQRLVDGLAAETLAAIGSHLAAGAQVLVFKNRRGFAPALLCHDCGWHAQCPHCDITLTWHKASRILRCHQCLHSIAAPMSCPDCASLSLQPQGAGTERLETALATAFPGVPLVRLDRDTTTRKHSFRDAIEELLRGESGLIVGTQMLAKGHHLPAVTLAVIAGVDESLMSADFRAAERLAQLIVQVAGRSGRAHRAGEVLLQTHQPEHPVLQIVLRHGYAPYAQAELDERKPVQLPPVTHALVIRAEHPRADAAENFLAEILATATSIREPKLEISGPLPAPQPRRQGRFRFQLIAICADRGPLHRFADRAVAAAHSSRRDAHLRWHIDVDPNDFG